MGYHGVQLAGTWRAPASGKLDELARAVGLRRGNCDAERLDRILTGHEGRTLLLDRVQEILELAAQRLLLPDVDFLLVVFERDLVQVERIEGSEGARAHRDRLLGVFDLDEVLQTGERELPDFHRREPVHLDEAVDAVVEAQQDVRMVLEVPVELPAAEGEDALDRRADEVPEDVDLVHAEVHHHADVSDPSGEGAHPARRGGHEVPVLALLHVSFHRGDRGIVSFDVAGREGDAGLFRGIDDPFRLLDRGGEGLLDEDGDARLDDVEGDLRMVLRRDAHADGVEFLLQEVRGVGIVGDVESVRDDAAGLDVGVGDPHDVGDLGVDPDVVLAHRADSDDADPHQRRHGNGESTSAYKRAAVVRVAQHRPQEPQGEILGSTVRTMTKRSYRFAASVGPSGDPMAIDPVCEKPVNPHNAYWMIWYKGAPYYFCSEDCQMKFDRKPEHYRLAALERHEKQAVY